MRGVSKNLFPQHDFTYSFISASFQLFQSRSSDWNKSEFHRETFWGFILYVCSVNKSKALLLSGERDSALCHLSLIDVTCAQTGPGPKREINIELEYAWTWVESSFLLVFVFPVSDASVAGIVLRAPTRTRAGVCAWPVRRRARTAGVTHAASPASRDTSSMVPAAVIAICMRMWRSTSLYKDQMILSSLCHCRLRCLRLMHPWATVSKGTNHSYFQKIMRALWALIWFANHVHVSKSVTRDMQNCFRAKPGGGLFTMRTLA